MASSNRFDTSQQQNYVSGHIPLPFEAISALGEKTNKDFQEGQNAEVELGALGQAIKAAPMHQDDRTNFINLYNNKTKELVDKYQGDYGNPNFKMDVKRLTNDFKNTPEIQAFEQTNEAYKNWERAKLSGNAKDLDYTYEMDPNDPTKFVQKSVLKDGVYSNRTTKFSDWGEAADKAVGQIAHSGGQNIGDLNLANTRIEGGKLFERKGNSWQGVTKTKLENVVESTIPVYAASEGGQNHLETILQKEFGFGQNAYNVRYMDIANESKDAIRRINAGQGTDADKKTVAMKSKIDEELYNFMYSSNKHQEGVISHKTIQDQIIADPKQTRSGSGGKNPQDQTLIPLSQVVANPDPTPGKVNAAFKAANPNSVFSFNDNGTMNKVDPYGKSLKVTYKGSDGKVWDPQNPPAKYRFYENEQDFKRDYPNTLWKGGYGSTKGVFVGSGGYEVPVHNLERVNETVQNIETYKKQVNEINSWAMLTNNYDKNKSGYENYLAALPKYESTMKNNVLNEQYLPAADADLKTAFSNFYFPKANEKGEVIQAGATSNWLIDGKPTKPDDFVGAVFKGFKSGEHSDDVLITTKDGKDHTVNMNDPTLKDNLNRLTIFQKNIHNSIMNPVATFKSNQEQSIEKTKAYKNIGGRLLQNIQSGEESYAIEDINELLNSYKQNEKNLMDNGYVYNNTYTDPKTGVVATSYINNKNNSSDVKVITWDPANASTVKQVPVDIFIKQITQKVIGGWSANINKSANTQAANLEYENPN